MTNPDIILIFLIAASAFMILCLSVVTLAKKNKKRINYINALIFFLYGAVHLCDMTYREGTQFLTPRLLYVNTPLVYILAPLTYIYFMMILHEDYRLKTRHLFLFLPGGLVLLGLIPYYSLDTSAKLACYPLVTAPFPWLSRFINGIKDTGGIIIFISFLLCMRSSFFLWNRTALAHIRIIRNVIIYMFGWILLACVYAGADISENMLLYRLAALTGNSMMIFYFILTYRYPRFFNKIHSESKMIKYRNSRLKNLDVKQIVLRLSHLMDRDEIYKDSSLSLEQLSRELGISPPQLSEILNSRFNANFNNYINDYRIDNIKTILADQPEANILQTALDGGFNSKTAFNTAFRKSTGMTPSQFRKKIRTES